MKVIRIQIDMMYQVPEDLVKSVYDTDVGFFKQMEEKFHEWAGDDKDPRDPINFDLRYHVGEVVDDTEGVDKTDREYLDRYGPVVLEGTEKYEEWLNLPCPNLGDRKPIELMDSEEGREAILHCLNKIEFGAIT